MAHLNEDSEGGSRAFEAHEHAENPTGRALGLLSITALGVVYGDIGTSPLYAIRECFHGPHAIAATTANVLGVLSLIFWALVIVISTKYLALILQANNDGEGGIIALASLITPVQDSLHGVNKYLLLLGLFGATLLYGDGMITPAISVLSAVEGLEVATPVFEPYIIPITVVILIGLFLFQKQGTARVGIIFGPITGIWFITIALLGLPHILEVPQVLWAVNPVYGFEFFLQNGWAGFLVLGAVFLVVTGGEALYADMGHFGTRPIRLTWFSFVLPALLLNYFGQGALLIGSPEMVDNPFYRLAPGWALYPLVILSTMATVIASQAVISGSFSLTMQAIQLGFSPRVEVKHTSAVQKGQIYMPVVNWMLMVACIGLVIGFQSSSRLAAAYGVAVATDMVITTVLFAIVMRRQWNWGLPIILTMATIFLLVDLSFFGANILKIPDGGWFPLVIAGVIFTVMTTWKTGRRILGQRFQQQVQPLRQFVDEIQQHRPQRVDGTVVYMYSNPNGTPPALLQNLKHNKILHERNIVLTIKTEEVPYVTDENRVEVEEIGEDFYRVTAHYGFIEEPNVPEVIDLLTIPGMEVDPAKVTYFLGHERIISVEQESGMQQWREKLFSWLTQISRPATRYYHLPREQVVEIGAQVEI